MKEKAVTIGNFTVPLVFILAFVLRIVLSTKYLGFGADIACFSAWADRMAELGPTRFYAKDYFSDYPPLYLYVLWIIGTIKKILQIESYSAIHIILIKLPAILSDIGIGYVIYRVGTKRLGLVHGIFLSSLYLFQPVVLMNSCLWGQVDSVFTLLLILSLYFLEKQSLLPAMLIFGIDVLLKPQALIFTPVLILGVIHYVFRGSFSMRMLINTCAYALLTVISIILLATPFGMNNVISQYVDTVSSYPYATVNAYNFWAGVGLNWNPQTTIFCGMPCSTWGFIAIVLGSAFTIVLGLRLGNLHGKYYVAASFLIITVFTFSVRMHERYLYPMIPLLMLGFTGFASRQSMAVASSAGNQEKKNDLSVTLKYGYPIASTLLIVLNFCNTSHVLFHYDPANYDSENPIFKIVGFGITASALFYYLILFRLQSKKELSESRDGSNLRMQKAIIVRESQTKMGRLDYILLLAITALYSFFALRDLGDTHAAQTAYAPPQARPITFNFPEETKVSSFYYFLGAAHNQQYLISCHEDGGDYKSVFQTLDPVFTWKEQTLLCPTDQVTLTAQGTKYEIMELVFLDENKNPIVPVNASEFPELFDEQQEFPERVSFRNSMYFDEIYHARTAYEYLHGLRSYENTHPPFGKVLISLGVSLFGMTPFGWRIIGTLFGIFMLPVLYLFAKRLTGDTASSALTCFIFAFDFMHFAQTRIATIDVYIVFFILCMYYFLYLFLSRDYAASPLKKLFLPLALCGTCMGFGVAAKWTGVYAGIGMGILFFLHVIRTCLKSKELTGKKKASRMKLFFASPLGKRTVKILGFCIIFFVAVPILIYTLSYIPFRDDSDHGLIKQALDNQNTMFSYHSTLEATHYFSSPFYEWPSIKRPIWYYSGILSSTLREGISSFGNPLVWWVGLPALIYMFYLAIGRKDKRAAFLIIGYFAQYLPWFFVSRLTFIYHYFPCVVFLALMIGYSFRSLKERLSKKVWLTILIGYAVFVFALFVMFYPVLSGQPVELDYVMKYLKWFKQWIFVSESVA